MIKTKKIKQCEICENINPEYYISKCGHGICQTCFLNFINDIKKSKKPQYSITCPIKNCKGQVDLKQLLKYLGPHNNCKKCGNDSSYTCGQCIIKEIEEVAKINYYTKLLKFEQIIPLEQQQEMQDDIIKYELICPVCREFNQLPIIICPQGHEICKDCYFNIRSIEDIRQVCPMCKQELLQLPPTSLRAQNLVRSLKVNCPECNKKIEYMDFISTHFRNCCEKKIECPGCQQKVELLFSDIHQSNYCPASQCPFQCDKKLENHQNNFIMEHLIAVMKNSDVANSFLHRMQVFERFLFYGAFGNCESCQSEYAWQVDLMGQTRTFCFSCFRCTQ